MKLFVANVGVNMSSARLRGLKSPVFPDGTFEFVPIKESSRYTHDGIPTYSDLPSVNGLSDSLAAYIPPAIAQYAVHNDPEFVTFTYGDVMSPRASNLRHIEPGDELWFLARLWEHDGCRWLGTSDFYFIGRLSVEKNVLVRDGTRPDSIDDEVRERIRDNAHYHRLAIAGAHDPFRVIIGDRERSCRFRQALKITPDVVGLLYAATYESERNIYVRQGKVACNRTNPRPRTFLNFGSTTRSIQSFLDSSDDVESLSLEKLLELAGAYGKIK